MTIKFVIGKCWEVGASNMDIKIYLAFRGPYIVLYFYNKIQRDALFLNFILVKNSTCF